LPRASKPEAALRQRWRRTERERQVGGGLEAVRGILLQAAPHDPVELGRNMPGQRRRLLVEDCGSGFEVRRTLERTPAGEHLVEDAAAGEDVGALVGALSAHLFGRHVAHRAEDGAFAGAALCGRRRQLGDAEVEDLEPALVRDEQILGLEIAVDDAFVVGGAQPLGKLQCPIDRLGGRQLLSAQPLAERCPLEQLRNDIRFAFEHADVVDDEHVRVIERSGRARFLLEPAQLLIAVRSGQQDLDGNFAAQLQVARGEYPAHASVSDLAFDRVPIAHQRERARRGIAGLRRDGLAADLFGVGDRATHRRRIPPVQGVDKPTAGRPGTSDKKDYVNSVPLCTCPGRDAPRHRAGALLHPTPRVPGRC
jgi:hypothetical protein